VIEGRLIIEIKSVEKLLPIHETYLRLSGLRKGLLLNFNCEMLRDGIRRLVL